MASTCGLCFCESSEFSGCRRGKTRATRSSHKQQNGNDDSSLRRAPFRKERPSPDGAYWGIKTLTLRACSHMHPHHRQSIMLFLFLSQVCGLTLSIADLKNAFCQSNSLDRSIGPLFVEPCEGLNLPPGITHTTRRPSVWPQRRASPLASYPDGLARQARISEIPLGTMCVCSPRTWWKC